MPAITLSAISASVRWIEPNVDFVALGLTLAPSIYIAGYHRRKW